MALLCESLERSLDFYCGVLGLEVGRQAGDAGWVPACGTGCALCLAMELCCTAHGVSMQDRSCWAVPV